MNGLIKKFRIKSFKESRPIVELQNLSITYGNRQIVEKLNLSIQKNEVSGLLGPNGAGKSTLLKGVIGTLVPMEGSLTLGSISRENIAYLPQQSDIDRSFPITVIDLVAMGLWRKIGPFGWLSTAQQSLVEKAIAAVGLSGFESRIIGSLSGGQMQRVLFARLLLQDAQLVLLDEPFNAIDTRTMTDLLKIITRWHGEGRTILAVLHNHDTVRTHFPQTLMIARELVAHGPTESVLTAENQFRARQMCEACAGPPHVCGRSVA
ncbi:MAG: metal ABC transporter ATP-binding protein [SAR324 cluster bacterium]|nr:metal ABC transporter ATP-binding protein [SAR324 cluster bacterium]